MSPSPRTSWTVSLQTNHHRCSNVPQSAISLFPLILYELSRLIPTLPLERLEYHDRREDFVEWAEGALGDGGLASRLRKVAHRRCQGEDLREALDHVESAHYEEIRQM